MHLLRCLYFHIWCLFQNKQNSAYLCIFCYFVHCFGIVFIDFFVPLILSCSLVIDDYLYCYVWISFFFFMFITIINFGLSFPWGFSVAIYIFILDCYKLLIPYFQMHVKKSLYVLSHLTVTVFGIMFSIWLFCMFLSCWLWM